MKALIPHELYAQIGVTLVNEHISLLNAFFIEFVMTFFLALTVFACIDSKRKDLGGSAPLTIGLSVTVAALFGVIELIILKCFKALYDYLIKLFKGTVYWWKYESG